MRDFERRFLDEQLRLRFWNVKQTARDLQVPLSTLKYRIRLHGLVRPTAWHRLDAGIPAPVSDGC